MVQKKNGTWRVTGDFRKLNAQTRPDRYPIPRIEDILNHLHDKKIFSAINLKSAYHQVPVAPADVSKTAVTTSFGLYEFLGMPPGLRNATQTFQRHMNNLLRGPPFVHAYIDDLIVASTSPEGHRQHLATVFQILRENSLRINFPKCQFGLSELRYLGYSVNENGYHPPEDRVEAIATFSKPETIADLRRFLGLLNYYRLCIPNAAHTQAPLTDLLKGAKKSSKKKIVWTPNTEQALQASKDSLISATKTSFLSPAGPLTLLTDASDKMIGAALEQEINGINKPVAFFSRKLSPTEMRYSTYDRELMAAFSAVKFFSHYLERKEFTIKTDHRTSHLCILTTYG